MRKKQLMNRILTGVLAFAMVFQSPTAALAQETNVMAASEQSISEERSSEDTAEDKSEKKKQNGGESNSGANGNADGAADGGSNAPAETTPDVELIPQSESVSSSEGSQSESGPQSESAQSESAPQSESAQSESAPQSESAQSESAPQSESAQSESAPQSETTQSESAPQSETTQSESTPQSESESETEAVSEEESETEAVTEEESEQHVAVEITHQMDQLKLNLSEAWYTAEDGSRVVLEDMQGGVDYRGIPETLLLQAQDEDAAEEAGERQITSGVSVLYRLQADGEARSVRAGDWFTVTFPEWMKNLRLTEDGQICQKGDNTQLDGIRCELDAQERRLKVTFTKKIDKKKSTGIHGRIGIAFEWDRELLAGKSQEAALVMQNQNGNENRSVILIPEKLLTDEEPESESETETELESETELATEPETELTTESETEITTEAETEIETELESEMEPAKLFSAPQRAPKKDDGVTIEKGGSAQAQIIWQDAVAGAAHPMQPGTVVCTIQTLGENGTDIIETKEYRISYDTDGVLQRNDVLWSLLKWNEAGDVPRVQLLGENALNQSLTLGDLPSKRTTVEQITEDGQESVTKTTVQTISWEICVNAAPEGCLMAADTDNHVYTMTPVTTFMARVEMRSGETVSGQEWQALKDNLKIYRNGQEAALAELVDRFVKGTPEPQIVIEPGENGAATLKITGLPWCGADKAEYVYSAAAGGKNTAAEHQKILIGDNSGDVLVQSIDNAESANFGSVTEVVHEGGLLALTRYGEMDFEGTKIWLDEGAQFRPDTKWELWRYTRGKGSYQQAAPVRDDAGNPIVEEVSKTEEPLTPIKISFETLPKYDASGEAYVYFVKEVMTGDTASQYEKVFGTLAYDEVGNPVSVDTSGDAAPNWNMDGDTVKDDTWQRGGDPSIYNGGTVCNRHTDTVEVEQAKAWIAANYQDDLHDVSVELTLQRRLKGDNTDDAAAQSQWENTDTTEVLTDFTAEQMVKSVEATMPKYDELGRELEYRWQETAVRETKDGAAGENLLQTNVDGMQIFRLSHNKEAKKIDGDEYYISEIAQTDTENYPAGTIVNRLVGTTRYDVRKVWAEDVEMSNSITVVLKQRGADGTVKKLEYELKNPNDGSRTWDLEITTLPGSNISLPKYDKGGRKYTYIVEEIVDVNGARYTPRYEYNNRDTLVDGSIDDSEEEVKEDVNNAVITNVPVGAGRLIRVRKEWLDDGDAAHRENVTVEVYRKVIEDNPLDNGQDQLLATVELGAGEQWWSYVDVTEFQLERSGSTYVGTKAELEAEGFNDAFTSANVYQEEFPYYIKETKMGSRAVDTGKRSLRGYPSISADTGSELHQHGYEVLYANPNGDYTSCTAPDGDGYYTVYNRRVGQIDIDVTKTWVDGGADADKREALGAKLVLDGAGTEYVFGSGDGSAQGGGLSLGEDPYGTKQDYLQPIYDGDSEDKKQVTNEQKLTGAGSTDDPNKETVRFYHLPKYDYQGRVLHYTVTEPLTEGMKNADYSVSVHDGAYESVDDNVDYGTDGHDKKTVEVENRRTGTKSIKFHKKWIDKAAYKGGNRPDIFLMLYRLDSQEREGVEAGVPVPNDYVEHEWSGHGEGDTDYQWTCTFDNLAKYDENGAVITYYAEEDTHAHPERFDYLDVQFASSADDKGRLSDISWNEEKKGYEVTHRIANAAFAADTVVEDAARPWVLTASDGKAVVKEDGWFVNELRAVVHVDGQKIWENIPNGFPVEELPKLTFVLSQKEKEAADQTASEALGASTEPAGKEVASIEDVVSEGLTFDFHFKYLGKNTVDGTLADENEQEAWTQLLPKYDPKTGALYEYSVSERIAQGQGEDVKTAYEKLPGEVNNYVITNTYNAVGGVEGNTGEISVAKSWNSKHSEAEDQITAAATFELHRFYENTAGTAYLGVTDGHGELVKSVTVQPQKTGAGGAVTADFGEQLVTAPNGKPYLYYIKEVKIGGFESVIEMAQGGATVEENEKLDSWPTEAGGTDCSKVFRFTADANTTANTEDAANALENIAADANGAAENAAADADTSAAALTYGDVALAATNTYHLTGDNGQITLHASKVWEDLNNLGGLRPDTMEFSLYREAEGQPEASGNNAIPREHLGTVTLKKGESGDTLAGTFTAEAGVVNILKEQPEVQVTGKWRDDTWKLTISPLDKWAPNAMLWKYTLVEEKIPDGYSENIEKETTIESGLEKDSAEMVLTPITNKNLTSLTVQKNWGQNGNLLRKDTTYALQVKEGDGAYQWAAVYFANRSSDWNRVIEETKTIPANGNSATWEQLPDHVRTNDGNAAPLTWRAVEIRIGEVNVRFGAGGENEVYKASAVAALRNLSVDYASADKQPDELLFAPSQSETSVTKSEASGTQPRTQTCAVSNTPMGGTVKLEITKTWVNDNDNKFHSRPMENGNWKVSYLVQRTTDGKTYENVLDRSNEPYVVAVSADAGNTATTTVDLLPKYNKDGEEYQYVAREVIRVGDEWKIVDNKANPMPGYTEAGNDAPPQKKETATDTYVSATINSYEMTTYHVGKNWIGDDNSFRPAVGAGTDTGADAATGAAGAGDVELTLWVFDSNGKSWEKAFEYWPEVSKASFQPSAVIATTEAGAEASWIFTFANLPKTDPEGNAYRYGVSETRVAGYNDPVYDSKLAADSGDEKIMELDPKEESFGGGTAAAVLENHATVFSLEKTGLNGAGLYAPYEVALTLTGADAATAGYSAVWTEAADGGKTSQSIQVIKDDTMIYESSTSDVADGSGEKLLIKGLPLGSYTLTETVTPQGSIPLAGTYTVTLASDMTGGNANGKTTLSVSESGSAENLVTVTEGSADSSDKLTVQNVATRFALVKTAADGTGEKLGGAEFTLSGKFPAYFAQYVSGSTSEAGFGSAEDTGESASEAGSGSAEGTGKNAAGVTAQSGVSGSIVLVTDEAGNAHIKGSETSRSWTDILFGGRASEDELAGLLIVGESYTLRETKAPNGYAQIDGTLEFIVENSGALKIINPVTGYALEPKDGDAGTHYGVLTASDKPIALTLKKQDAAGKPLAGAEFALYEYKADNGASDTDSNVSSAGNRANGADNDADEDHRSGSEKPMATFTIGVNGTVDLVAALSPHKLIVGKTYRLVETKAPEGYILPGNPSDTQNRSLIFTVTANGKIKAKAVPKDSIFAGMGAEPAETIVAVNKPITMKLHKTNEDGTTYLTGAEFMLERKAKDSLAGWVVQAQELKTNGEGVLMLGVKSTENSVGQPDLTLVQGMTYRLTETKTSASSYQMPQEAKDRRMTFTVNTDGTVTIDAAQSNMELFAVEGTDGASIVMKNELTKLVLRKVDNETQEEITDDELTLSIEAVNGKAEDSDARTQVFTWKHTAEGYSIEIKAARGYSDLAIDGKTGLISGLPAGTYRVSEVETPNGYLTIAPFTFTLDAYNNVTAEEKSYVSVESDKAEHEEQTIVITDEVIRGHVILTKKFAETNEAGGPLEGVHFDLYRVNENIDADAQNGETDHDADAGENGTGSEAGTGENGTGSEAGTGEDGAGAPDVRIAENLVTDADGTWTSVKNDRDHFADGTEANTPFSKGLRSGTYYFVETQATADGKLDHTPIVFTISGEGALPGDAGADASAQDADVSAQNADASAQEVGTVQPSDEKNPVTVEVINEAFEASLTLTKRDAQTKEPINKDVFFHLEKKSNEADGASYAEGMTVTPYETKGGVTQEISEDGTLTFEELTKGTYLLTEVSAKGYDEASMFSATVVIGEADDGKTVEVKTEDDEAEKKHFSEVKGTLTADGITNARKTAALTFTKRDAQDAEQVLTDVIFTLQRRVDISGSGDESTGDADSNGSGNVNVNGTGAEASAIYEDCMTGLRTGYAYAFNDVQCGTDGNHTDSHSSDTDKTEPQPTEDGTLRLTGIPWGEYRLVETQAKDGYGISEKDASDPKQVVREFTVSRDNFDEENIAELVIDDLVNYQTSLTLKKQGTDGAGKLSGAVFTISGERFAKEENAGKTSIEVTTGTDGTVTLQGVLVTGVTYTVEEIKAPNGYQLIETPIQFKMTADGTAELVSETSAGNTSAQNNSLAESTSAQRTASAQEGYSLEAAGSYENILVVTDAPQPPESESELEVPTKPQKPSDQAEPQDESESETEIETELLSESEDDGKKPTNDSGTDDSARNPQSGAKTGDETNLLLYLLLMLVSGTAGAALFARRRKRNS